MNKLQAKELASFMGRTCHVSCIKHPVPSGTPVQFQSPGCFDDSWSCGPPASWALGLGLDRTQQTCGRRQQKTGGGRRSRDPSASACLHFPQQGPLEIWNWKPKTQRRGWQGKHGARDSFAAIINRAEPREVKQRTPIRIRLLFLGAEEEGKEGRTAAAAAVRMHSTNLLLEEPIRMASILEPSKPVSLPPCRPPVVMFRFVSSLIRAGSVAEPLPRLRPD